MMSLKKYGVIIIVLASVIAAGFLADWAFRTSVSQQTTSAFADPDEYIKNLNMSLRAQASTIPQGLGQELADSRIYLMLANKGSAYAQPHVLEDGRISPMPEDGFEDWYYSTSPDGNFMTFLVATSDRIAASHEWDALARLYVTKNPALEDRAFPESFSDADIVEDGNVRYRQLPTVSNEGTVLFMGGATDNPETWGIFLSDASGVRMLTRGFMPRWLSDTTFVFLKEDGIYVSNLTTQKERRIVEATDTLSYPEDRIAVSRDGKMMAWTHAARGEIRIFDIDADPTYVFTERGTVPVYGTWAAISPSNSFLAVTVADDNAPRTDQSRARVEFFDLSTFTRVPGFSLDLSAFERSYIFITDWAPRTIY